jgi:preprotein translocase subunit SecE
MLGVRIPPALPLLSETSRGDGEERQRQDSEQSSGGEQGFGQAVAHGHQEPLLTPFLRPGLEADRRPGTVAAKPQGRVRTFLREVRVEMSKVTWPPRKELITSTGVVIVAVIIAGVYIGVWDFVWNLIVRAVGLG